MDPLCIVPCSNRKIWDTDPDRGPTQAKFVYTGKFATKCKEYAMKFYPNSWCIISAKYGFLFPDDLVSGPYNVSFNIKKTNPIKISDLCAQAKHKGLTNYDKIVVLGGCNYANMMKTIFYDKEIILPLSDCNGIWRMISKLNNAVKRGSID